ncbi:hypothetical protein ACJ41O_003433 [Fusarium nematophilum]
MTKLSFFLAALVGSAIAAPSTPLVTEAPKADVVFKGTTTWGYKEWTGPLRKISGKKITDITFSGGLCSSGHGLSIGSVGNRANNVVDTVKFLNSQVTKSTQAIRVKTFKGATGQVKRITHSDITISKASKYGILIEQNYDGGDLHGEPTSTLPITGLTLKNIYGQGAVNSKGTNIAIVCGSSGCSNWTWSIVKVSGGKNYSSCQNVPSVAICKA